MIYNIRGDKILVTDAIKEYIASKLDKLNKYFDSPEDITANILVKVKGFEQTIEVTFIACNPFCVLIKSNSTSWPSFSVL